MGHVQEGYTQVLILLNQALNFYRTESGGLSFSGKAAVAFWASSLLLALMFMIALMYVATFGIEFFQLGAKINRRRRRSE